MYMEDKLFSFTLNAADSMLKTPILYKYLGISGGIMSLQNTNLMFRRPDKFNDPFDCSIELLNIDAETTRSHMSKAFTRILGNDYRERFRLANQLSRANDDQVIRMARVGLESELHHRGVCCFSKTNDNILMWAHYCKNYNGICIGYHTVNLYEFLRSKIQESAFLPVEYADEIQKKNLYETNSDAILHWLKAKANDWQYEKEIRITGSGFSFDTEGCSFIDIPKNLIAEIYIGKNVSSKNIQDICDFAANSSSDIKIFKMEPNFTSFCLKAVEFQPNL